jgi:type III secretion protein J
MMKDSTINSRKKTSLSPFFRFLCSVVVLCFCLPLLTSCEGQKTIVNGLDEKEANEILVYLSTKGIDSVKVKQETAGGGGNKAVLWDINVRTSHATEAMYLLNQQGLPRRRGQNLLSIFSTSGLVPSDMQEKIKYRAGLSEQIANTIRKIDGILDGEVQISFPEEDPLNPGQSKGKITASVYVKHSGVLDDPNSHLLTKIKRLVAASVTGLDYDNVTVITERSRLSEPTSLSSASMDENKQYVSIWTIIVAKESVTRFRVIFFSFCLIILTMGLLLLWTLWKVLPLISKHGGIKSLFSISPLSSTAAPVIEIKESGKPATNPEVKTEKPPVEKGIDET